jgi:hypothetical protein
VAIAVGATFLLADSTTSQFRYEWTTVLGAPTGNLEIKAFKSDSAGNIFVAGNFTSTFSGVTSQGGSDIFIRKYSPDGTVLWTKFIGGTYDDVAYAMAVNSAGEVIVGGIFGGAVDFDPSEGADAKTGTQGGSAKNNNAFLLKLTAGGGYAWSKILKQAVITSVVCDAAGAIFYAGSFQSLSSTTSPGVTGYTTQVNFHPNGGSDLKTSKNTYSYYQYKPDFFLSKISADGGTYYWTQTYGEISQGFIPTALSVNGTAVYLAGVKGYSGDEKAFLAKYSTDYTTSYEWMKTDGTKTAPADMVIDSAGNIYLAGITGFTNTLSSSYSARAFPAVSGSPRGYVKKYDPSGAVLWSYQTENSDPLVLLSLAVDASGNVYAAGGFQGIADFDGDPTKQDFRTSSAGTKDIFYLRLSPTGTYDWVQILGSFGQDMGERVLMVGNSLYVAGLFSGGINFDFTGGNDYVSSISPQSEFVTKLTLYSPTSGQIKGVVSSVAGATTMRIGNATVSLEGTAYTTTTVADGSFSFLDLPPGNYVLNATAENFQNAGQSVSVVAGQTMTPNIDMGFLCSLTQANISGQVMSTAGNANLLIGNATVTLLDSNGEAVYTTTTDTGGNFVFSNVAPGAYTVRMGADNFETINRQVTVASGTSLNMAASQTQLGVQCITAEGSAGVIVIDPESPTTLYTAIDGSGIYKSTDGASTWVPANTQPTNTHIKALVVKPGDSARLFAASYGSGVYHSINSGVDWSVCANTNLTNLNLLSLTIDAGGKLFAGSEAGVFVSSDNCATWSAMSSGLP